MRANFDATTKSTWIAIQRRLLEEARREWMQYLDGIIVGGKVSGGRVGGTLPPIVLPTTFTTINFIIDGGGDVIATGTKGFLVSDVAGSIIAATLLGDVSGSAVVDIKKATFSAFPTTASITASAKPTLSTAQKSQDSTLTGWTTSVLAGDIFEFIVDSCSTITRLTVSLAIRRS